jgi:SAM-dependent methyltransferase
MHVSSDNHFNAIIANPQWLRALNRWCYAQCRPCECKSDFFELAPDSWQVLQAHLVGTGLFERTENHITPTPDGQGFIVRINELCRSIDREKKEDKVVIQILDGLPRGGAVDIGCGPGHSALRLARMGYTPVYAYDLSSMAIEIGRTLFEQDGRTAHLFSTDATHLSEIRTGSLALIFSRGALHYFSQSDLAKSFNRTLRPGGHVVAEIIGLRYYLQAKHIRGGLVWRRLRKPLSYVRTVMRTLLYEALSVQPRLAAGAPEIGYTKRTIHRFARWAGLEVISISSAPASVGYLLVMRKPGEHAL